MANLENKKAGSKEHWQKVTDKAQAREARTDALYQLEKVGFTFKQDLWQKGVFVFILMYNESISYIVVKFRKFRTIQS